MGRISTYCRQTIYLQRRASLDGDGRPTFADSVPVRGRWNIRTKLVRLPNREEKTSTVEVILDPADANCTPAPVIGDRLSIDDTTFLDILTVAGPQSMFGTAPDHYEIAI